MNAAGAAGSGRFTGRGVLLLVVGDGDWGGDCSGGWGGDCGGDCGGNCCGGDYDYMMMVVIMVLIVVVIVW